MLYVYHRRARGRGVLTLLDRLGNVLEVVLLALVVRRDGRRCPGLAIGAKLRININIYELVSPDGNVFALLLSLHVPCALCSANASTLRTGNRQRTIAALVIQPTQQSAMQKEAKSVARCRDYLILVVNLQYPYTQSVQTSLFGAAPVRCVHEKCPPLREPWRAGLCFGHARGCFG